MTPILEAEKFYGWSFPSILYRYVSDHYVYASPTCICLAKPEGDWWWIEFYAGDMKEALNHLPYWLPQIRFNRRGKPKAYWTANIVKKVLRSPTFSDNPVKDATAEDGLADPLPRGGRGRTEGETTPAAVAHHCG